MRHSVKRQSARLTTPSALTWRDGGREGILSRLVDSHPLPRCLTSNSSIAYRAACVNGQRRAPESNRMGVNPQNACKTPSTTGRIRPPLSILAHNHASCNGRALNAKALGYPAQGFGTDGGDTDAASISPLRSRFDRLSGSQESHPQYSTLPAGFQGALCEDFVKAMPPDGLEPTTSKMRLSGSIQLSYGGIARSVGDFTKQDKRTALRGLVVVAPQGQEAAK